jgi:hypothetical protein
LASFSLKIGHGSGSFHIKTLARTASHPECAQERFAQEVRSAPVLVLAIVLVEELVAEMNGKNSVQARYLIRHTLGMIGTATRAHQRDWGIRQQGNENGCGGGIQLSWLLPWTCVRLCRYDERGRRR